MPCLVTERKLSPTPLTSEQVRRMLRIGIVLHLSTFVGGFVGILTITLIGNEERESLLPVETESPSELCADLLKLSMLLLIMNGFSGILSQFMSYHKFSAYLLPITCLLVLGLGTVAMVAVVNIDIRSVHKITTESFIRESYNKRHTQWINAINYYHGGWEDEIQIKLACCGVADKRDWFLSVCNCIPPTCCKPNERLNCKRKFLQTTPSGLVSFKQLGPSQVFTSVTGTLSEDTCIDKLQAILIDIKSTWIKTTLWLMCFEFWLLFSLLYMSFIVEELYETDRGKEQLQDYKWSLPIRKKLSKPHLYDVFKSLHSLREDVLTEKNQKSTHKDFIEIEGNKHKKSFVNFAS